MRAGPAPDAMKPGFQGVRTRWNQGFMPFRQLWRTRIVMLMVPGWPECDLRAPSALAPALRSAVTSKPTHLAM